MSTATTDAKMAQLEAILARLPLAATHQLLALANAMVEEIETDRAVTKQSIRRHAARLGIEAGAIILEGYPDEVEA